MAAGQKLRAASTVFQIEDLITGAVMTFPMFPETISVQASTLYSKYTVLAVGEISVPSGESLLTFSWNGILPGENRRYDPFVRNWINPKDIQSTWSVWRYYKRKLNLKVDVGNTPINHHVYLNSYAVEYSGGYGDYNYDISFTQAKDITISPIAATVNPFETGEAPDARPEPPPATTYTVVRGDGLFAIAEKTLGDGGRYMEIYEANRALIDENSRAAGGVPYLIHPGQVLNIPR